jgi:CRISPR-associated exonuclease Cas4
MTSGAWIAAGAVLALLAGGLLVAGGNRLRRSFGLGKGLTVALDNVTLTSPRYGLRCRMDRMIRAGRIVTPEEWKSALIVRPWHRAQIGVDFLLIEDQMGVKPSHGFIVCGDGARHRIDNTDELRAWVLELAGQIRAARANVMQPMPVNPKPGQCPPCGQRSNCGQAQL